MVRTNTKQYIHNLVDMIDAKEDIFILHMLLKLVPADIATNEELQALKIADEQFSNGEFEEFDAAEWA